MKIRTKAPNFALTKELNENMNKSTKFWLKVWQDWALAREYKFIMMLTEKYPILSYVVILAKCPNITRTINP
jgi:hypothetical protein